MGKNLPIAGSPKERVRQFIQEFKVARHEQTRLREQGHFKDIEAGDREQALAALARMRPSDESFTSGAGRDESRGLQVVGGTKEEQRVADFLSRRLAETAAADSEVLAMRRAVVGRTEPLARDEAWAMLDAPGSALAGSHHGGLLAPLTLPGAGRNREAADRHERRGFGRGDVLVPRTGSFWTSVQRLVLWYRWSEGQAAWFLLTGEPPMVPAVTAQVTTTEGRVLGATITVTALPHVSGESAAAMLKKARRRLLGSRGPLALERRLMAEFVDAERAKGGPLPWAQLLERWNRLAPPKWRYLSPPEMRRACQHEKERDVVREVRKRRVRRRPRRRL